MDALDKKGKLFAVYRCGGDWLRYADLPCDAHDIARADGKSAAAKRAQPLSSTDVVVGVACPAMERAS